jgi:hypothetical protein
MTMRKYLVAGSAFALATALTATPAAAQEACVTDSGSGPAPSGIATGTPSLACGSGATASGDFSTAVGQNSVASGQYSTATGNYAQALGDDATAVGVNSTANAFGTAVGFSSRAGNDRGRHRCSGLGRLVDGRRLLRELGWLRFDGSRRSRQCSGF